MMNFLNKNKKTLDTKDITVDIDYESYQPFHQKAKTFYFRQKVVVFMFLRSGKIRTFLVDSVHKTFKYRKGEYIIDSSCYVYNESMRLYQGFYHQDFTNPVKIDIPVNDLHKGLRQTEAEVIQYSAYPSTLLSVLRSSLVETAIKASNAFKDIGTYKFLWFANLVLTGFVLILVLRISGVF